MRFWGLTVACAMLGGCVTTLPTDEMLTAYEAGEKAIAIMNVAGDLPCEMLWLKIRRERDGDILEIKSVRDLGYRSSDPGILVLEPGRYRIAEGACILQDVRVELAYLDSWFGEFDLLPRQVAYLGTLRLATIDPNDGKFRVVNNYLSYRLTDDTDVGDRVSARYPDLAKRMVFSPPRQLVSAESFSNAVRTALAPGSGGKPFSEREAKRRLATEFERRR